jgi:predicted DNA-binding transcriptional regulator YafY
MRVMAPPITAQRLAKERGVSIRSIYRDIELLRLAGARIDGERGYGYRLIEDYALPPQTFDRMEIEAIAVGLGEVRQMGDPDLAQAAEAVLAKVAATLPDDREQQLMHSISHVYRPDGRYGPHPHLNAIRRACWEEETIEIAYRNQAGTDSQRAIQPLAIMFTDHALTVLAWCGLREDFRMFRVERISEVKRSGRSFRPRRAALLRDYLARLSEK